MLPEISDTFHGRDIFAPTAVYIEKGVAATNFGPRIDDPVRPDFIQVKHEKGHIIGSVLYVDSFGNIITNIRKNNVQSEIINVKIQDTQLEIKLKKTYGETKHQDTIALYW